MTDKTYNGWTNYETWAVALWWDNDEGSYSLRQEAWREICSRDLDTRQALSVARTRRRAQEYTRQAQLSAFADWLKETTEENAPDLGATLYGDLLRAAFSEVNWYEIAKNWTEE